MDGVNTDLLRFFGEVPDDAVGARAQIDNLPAGDHRRRGVEEATRSTSVSSTWTHPYDVYPDPHLGSLGVVPPDLFMALLTRLPIESVAVLSETGHALADIVHSTRSPYMTVLPLISRAWHEDIGDAAIVDMLQVINAVPLATRPTALRALACCIMVKPKRLKDETLISPGMWAQILQDTRAAILKERDVKDCPQCIAELDIAGWYMLDLSEGDAAKAFGSACRARLEELPFRYWPAVLDAAVTRSRDLAWLDVDGIVEDESIVFPSLPDRVVIAFASAAVRTIGPRVFSIMRARFGVTDAQYMQLLWPREAIRVAESRRRSGVSFAVAWRVFGAADPALVAMAEHIALQDALPMFYTTDGLHAPRLTGRDSREPNVDGRAEVARWEKNLAAYFQRVEAAAIHSKLNVDLPNDAAGEQLFCAVKSLTRTLQGDEDLLPCLAQIRTQPLGFQPVLMDCWAGLRFGVKDSGECQALLDEVSRWCESVVPAFVSCGEHENAVRACVAELRATFNLTGGNAMLFEHVMHKAIGMVLSMPSESWGPMLGYLKPHSRQLQIGLRLNTGTDREQDERSAPVLQWTKTFLLNPLSSFVEPPANHDYLHEVAAMIFSELPDEADASASKFERVCQRFCIPYGDAEQMKRTILRNIAKTIPDDAPALRSTIRAALARAGFTDDASFLAVLTNRRVDQGHARDDEWRAGIHTP